MELCASIMRTRVGKPLSEKRRIGSQRPQPAKETPHVPPAHRILNRPSRPRDRRRRGRRWGGSWWITVDTYEPAHYRYDRDECLARVERVDGQQLLVLRPTA